MLTIKIVEDTNDTHTQELLIAFNYSNYCRSLMYIYRKAISRCWSNLYKHKII